MNKRRKPEKYMITCPNCKKEVPENIKVCWVCREILEPRLKELIGVTLKQVRERKSKKR